jgi:hypothetical protein
MRKFESFSAGQGRGREGKGGKELCIVEEREEFIEEPFSAFVAEFVV